MGQSWHSLLKIPDLQLESIEMIFCDIPDEFDIKFSRFFPSVRRIKVTCSNRDEPGNLTWAAYSKIIDGLHRIFPGCDTIQLWNHERIYDPEVSVLESGQFLAKVHESLRRMAVVYQRTSIRKVETVVTTPCLDVSVIYNVRFDFLLVKRRGKSIKLSIEMPQRTSKPFIRAMVSYPH